MATIKQVFMTGVLGAACGVLLVLLTSEGASAQSPFYPLVQKPVPPTPPDLVVNPKNYKIQSFAAPRLGPAMYAGKMMGPHILTLKPWRPKYFHPRPFYGPNLP
jgi:hypothetical protein